MICISAQPWDFYFTWQVEVQIFNFRRFGLADKMQVLIWIPTKSAKREPDGQSWEDEKVERIQLWKDLETRYPEVKFFYYEDEGVDQDLYIPQLRPQILAKHFNAYPELEKEAIFYHDCDIIFNYLPDFEALTEGPINWTSNTSSYLDYRYLYFKEKQGGMPKRESICTLTEIGNISPKIFASYRGNTGGAQYILKNMTSDIWRDVERQVLLIRKAFVYSQPNSINSRYFSCEAAGFQSWCADMWALNMALWSRQRPVETTSMLDFSWATDNRETFLRKPIMHNAGATGTQPGVFFKSNWMEKSPIGVNHAIKKDTASWFYVKEIKDTAQSLISTALTK